MAIKLQQNFPSQGLPKYTKSGIFGMRIGIQSDNSVVVNPYHHGATKYV
jgi:hypothetical protein